MTLSASTPYRIVVSELTPDGTVKERIAGDCSAYLVTITAEINGELRILTDHDGPSDQRRTALASLTAHIKATIGLGR
ncbi:MAG: hypothetical protein ACYC1D_00700 [Acidimicrobiales bacterium]